MPLPSILLLFACQLSASTEVLDDTGDLDPGDGGGVDGGTADGGGTSADGGGTADGGTQKDPDATDDDLDGWSEDQGDCDDADGGVNPGVTDGCDGIDSDCDDSLDEDARSDDATEPNDDAAYSMGELSADGELQVLALLHNDDDVDRFRFDIEDGSFSIFELRVSVANIPSGSSYHVLVEHLDLGIVYLDESGSGSLEVVVDDTLIQDDGGTWEITVESEGGADCGREYLVTVGLDE